MKKYELEEARLYPNHLGILGLFRLLGELKQAGRSPAIVVSEFGEELMGLRDVLANELARRFEEMRVFPGDIGHTVVFEGGEVRIVCSHEGKCRCNREARGFLEHDGRIRLLCDEHLPTIGSLD